MANEIPEIWFVWRVSTRQTNQISGISLAICVSPTPEVVMPDQIRSGEYISFVRQGGIPVTIVKYGGLYVRVVSYGGKPVTFVRSGGTPISVDMEAELPEEIKEEIGY